MTLRHLVLQSLRYHRRTGLIVAIGIAVATAVLTGSLLVGDSVTGSLRRLALARLGNVETALAAPHFFRAQLAGDLDEGAVALTQLRGPARNPATEAVQPEVEVYGVDGGFWGFFPGVSPSLTGRQAAVNAALAGDLGLREGDSLFVKVDREGMTAADSLFAQRAPSRTTRLLRLRVAAILPDRGAGAFSLVSTPSAPRTLFLSRDWLMEQLGKPGRANVILAKDTDGLQDKLAKTCTPADYGLKIVSNAGQNSIAVQSETMLLSAVQVRAIQYALADCGSNGNLASVYLAKTIKNQNGRRIGYAMLAAGDPPAPFTFREGGRRALDPMDIWLNEWAAKDLDAHPDDYVTIEYIVPQADGTYGSRYIWLFVRGILRLTGSALDRQMAPEIAGVTEVSRIDAWDAPFPVDMRLITPRDEMYWERYRATPKAFVHPATLRAMCSNGESNTQGKWITAMRGKAPTGADLAKVEADLSRALTQRLKPKENGMDFRPVRRLALQSANGNTDFGQLFLGMGLFLVLAAAGLAGTFMRLHIERRAAEVGILRACGFRPRTISRVLLAEACAWVLLGALAGAPLGVGYGWLIVHGLATWWRGAIGATPLAFHLTGSALLIGICSGVLVGVLATARGATSLAREQVLSLLSGWRAAGMVADNRFPLRMWAVTITLVVLAIALMFLPGRVGFLTSQTAFFISGGSLLVAGLLAASLGLRYALNMRGGAWTKRRLAVRNAAANRRRSLLVIGLAASAAFVLMATAANRRDPTRLDVTRKDSGAGGFSLLATSSLPIHYGFDSAAGREALGFALEDEPALAHITAIPFRRSPGEDISCLNLARPAAPRVLSISKDMIRRGGFTVLTKKGSPDNPWELLERGTDKDGAVPVFGDADSVRWTLHADLGKVYLLSTPAGPVKVRFAGLLPGSVFAGELLMGEINFNRLFPGAGGPTFFLIATPPGVEQQAAAALRKGLGEMGLTVRGTREVLAGYAAVQNTYIATFLALGGLGLLLGVFGMIIIQLRNAFERRRELALLQAVGFRAEELSSLLALENAGLLLVGLLLGTIAALVAVAPQLASSVTRVPWGMVIGLLIAIAALGISSSILSAQASLRGDLIGALREE
ncbi:MAG: FtsX-like permease family protein [Armatimonadota bacterium]